MKDARGTIIYVGKAKVLKSRVASYFRANNQDIKTSQLVRDIDDFDVILTTTEVDAFLLERTLIKHHSPKFNINLRDDKEYPYLRVNLQDEWPRFEKVRKHKDDGAVYLGPFSSAGQLRVMVNWMQRVFPLIRCSKHEFANAKRPCNYYHMKMCLGPCTLPVSREVYLAMVQNGIGFLEGKNQEVLTKLQQSMLEAAESEKFELAAQYRDQIQAFERITERQSVVIDSVQSADALGMFVTEHGIAFSVLMVRAGRVVAQEDFLIRQQLQEGEDATAVFLMQYYEARGLPARILLPRAFESGDALAIALTRMHTEESTPPPSVETPESGTLRELVEIANKNAKYQWEEAQRTDEKRTAELTALATTLKLTKFPRRMECIDISNIQGTAIVASNVCFMDGKPAKDKYRLYNVKTVTDAPDDFASIEEVVERRIERGLRDGDLPDLLVIDGGRGQLSAAMKVKALFPSLDLPLVGLAKSRVDKGQNRRFVRSQAPERSFERVFLEDSETPIPLSPGSPEYRLMTHIRDEAHRFAINHHRKRRSKLAKTSVLDDIPGVGATLRKRLLVQFGDVARLRKASVDEIARVEGMTEKKALVVYNYLQSEN
jgi:excinuclease ABC subunit C